MLSLDQPLAPRSGITIVRLMMGVILLLAGLAKWAGGIGGTIAFFTQLGIPLPQVMGPVIATGELVGGILLIVGFGTRAVGVWFVCEFLVTAFYVKLARGAGWDAARLDLMLLAGSVMLIIGGAGRLAVQEWIAHRGTVAAPAQPAQVSPTH